MILSSIYFVLPLVAFAFAIGDHPEEVRRRSPQRGKEDGEAEANTPYPYTPSGYRCIGVRGVRLWRKQWITDVLPKVIY